MFHASISSIWLSSICFSSHSPKSLALCNFSCLAISFPYYQFRVIQGKKGEANICCCTAYFPLTSFTFIVSLNQHGTGEKIGRALGTLDGFTLIFTSHLLFFSRSSFVSSFIRIPNHFLSQLFLELLRKNIQDFFKENTVLCILRSHCELNNTSFTKTPLLQLPSGIANASPSRHFA